MIAEETGGIAVVNQNDFGKAIRRIDAEMSDYYVLGFYSKNPDPLRKNRRLEVKVKRPGIISIFRREYFDQAASRTRVRGEEVGPLTSAR